MQCKEWDDANSKLFKESHDGAVYKNPYKSRFYELISASLVHQPTKSVLFILAAEPPTTTLTAKGRVKPESPVKPENPHAQRACP